MTYTAPSDSFFLAPDINTLTYLITYPAEYSSSKKLDSHSPNGNAVYTALCKKYARVVQKAVGLPRF